MVTFDKEGRPVSHPQAQSRIRGHYGKSPTLSMMKDLLAEEQARDVTRHLLGGAETYIPKDSVGLVYGLALFDEPVIPCDLPDTFKVMGLDPEPKPEPKVNKAYEHQVKMNARLMTINDVRAKTIVNGEMGRVFGLPVVQSEFVRPNELVVVKDTARVSG